MLGPHDLMSGLAESARNFAFLAFMYGIVRSAAEDDRQRAVKVVYCTVAGVIGLQIVIAGVLPRFEGREAGLRGADHHRQHPRPDHLGRLAWCWSTISTARPRRTAAGASGCR